MRVGFVGLGSQGAPMAERIAAAGWPLTIYARRPQSLERFSDSPAVVAASLSELASRSDLVGVCVVDDAQVEQVLGGESGLLAGMSAGGIVAVHSTVHPDTCRRQAHLGASRGVSVVDAPVSGGAAAASAGRLSVLAGGPAEAIDRCRPVFESFAGTILHLGPVGSGQVAKLINNLLFVAHLGLARDAVAFGDRLGVAADGLEESLLAGTGASAALEIIHRARSLGALSAGTALLEKDVELTAAVAGAAGLDLSALGDAARHGLDLLRAAGQDGPQYDR
ncbi:MAG: NAD(P)-dependent oxidoreductase [Acidimicrobiales bacterium]